MLKDLYFLQLTIYQYDKKKIKMDYSCIPVSFKEVSLYGFPTTIKSEVSDETINIKKMLFTEHFVDAYVEENPTTFTCSEDYNMFLVGEVHDKQREGKAIKTSILVYSKEGLSKEEIMKVWLKRIFRKRWFYKFKYLKFLKKKEELNQF